MVSEYENAALQYIEGEERKKYAKKHGVNSLINYFHGLHWNDKESERVYGICNKRGITWQEYYEIGKRDGVIY